MTDRALLEKAAKAAGFDTPRFNDGSLGRGVGISTETGPYCQRLWNPLNDDGDALRLAVKLRLRVDVYGYRVKVSRGSLVEADEKFDVGDPYAATRRAIVRAAAAIGEHL